MLHSDNYFGTAGLMRTMKIVVAFVLLPWLLLYCAFIVLRLLTLRLAFQFSKKRAADETGKTA